MRYPPLTEADAGSWSSSVSSASARSALARPAPAWQALAQPLPVWQAAAQSAPVWQAEAQPAPVWQVPALPVPAQSWQAPAQPPSAWPAQAWPAPEWSGARDGRGEPPPLVAVAHGSADPRAAAAVADLMTVVRARAARAGLEGLQVRAAYLGHALPSVPDVLEALSAAPGSPGPRRPVPGERPVVVLPLLLTGAFHTDTDLPAVLAEAAARLPRLRISYGDPLGPHPFLLRALERRLAGAGVLADDTAATRDTAVVLAAAGSSRTSANAALARVAAAWQSARGWHAVIPAFASAAAPTPAEAVTELLRAGAPRVVVATYLLAPGYFADRVRETSLAAGAEAVSPALGPAPEVADLILERYLQATLNPRPAAAAAGA